MYGDYRAIHPFHAQFVHTGQFDPQQFLAGSAEGCVRGFSESLLITTLSKRLLRYNLRGRGHQAIHGITPCIKAAAKRKVKSLRPAYNVAP